MKKESPDIAMHLLMHSFLMHLKLAVPGMEVLTKWRRLSFLMHLKPDCAGYGSSHFVM